MKIEYFMHGFWFYHAKYGNVRVEDFDNDFGDEPSVVVYSEDIPHKDGYRYGYRCVDLDELEPLPLTPETLEMNGFCLTTYENASNRVWERNDFAFGEHGEIAMGIQKGWQNVKIEFVHELQMAMRFCGIEKDIEI